MRLSAVSLTLIMLISGLASAQIYTWTDSDGNVHFGDAKNMPEAAKSQEVELGKINTITSVTFEEVKEPQEEVIMYSASWCGYCRKARNYFEAQGIPFKEYDIEKSPAAAKRYKKLGASGVPVILYKDKRMNGFTKAGFDRIYQPDA